MKNINKPELMAPAGDWAMLRAAVQHGANAVYLGLDTLNMRAKAKNFTEENIHEVVEYCHENNVKVYVTVNTIVKEDELSDLIRILTAVKNANVDMIICWDFAVIQQCKEMEIPFCISTQASISNSASAAFFKSIGAARIVLARECSLEEIKEIRKNTDLEIETFIHGAMCVAVSGRCFLSHHLFDKSANRGECIQPCRREFEIHDTRISGKSLVLGTDYVMSAKDLCSIEFIDQLIEANIDSFKIEGRKRSPEYVAKVVSVYRKAIDDYFENKLTTEKKEEYLKELKKVYNRGFSSGFYFDRPAGDEFASVHGSDATTKKQYVGKVITYYKQPKVAYIRVESTPFRKGDTLLIIGNATGVVELQANELRDEDKNDITTAKQKMGVTFPCAGQVRPNDQVYVIEEIVPKSEQNDFS